jgi:thiosulfate dehydrogenase (quinone) large subunit
MTNSLELPPHDATRATSDASLGYAILRLTFGVNIALRGMTRIANGTDLFAADLLKQFENSLLPAASVQVFGLVLPWVESVIGLLLVTGLQTRPALIAGGLMMTVLTAGTMLIQNFQTAWLQLTYAVVFFILLACRGWNALSLDGWLVRRRAHAHRAAAHREHERDRARPPAL